MWTYRVPDFEAAQMAGFESSDFSINNNLTQDDHRQLDIEEVRRIMLQKNCTFDEVYPIISSSSTWL